MALVNRERLLAVFDYDPGAGALTWRVRLSNRTKVGAIAGTINKHGYVRVSVDGVQTYAHEIIWKMVHGDYDQMDIDHINLNRSDNRLANLRLVTRGENNLNKPVRSDNRTGIKGVSFDECRRLFCARIRRDGKVFYLGRFASSEDARRAYANAAARLHGEFARLA